MNKLQKVISILLTLTILIACSKNNGPAPEISIDLSKIQTNSKGDVVVANSTGTKSTFTIESNTDWSASQSGNYNFNISPLSGSAGKNDVTIIGVTNTGTTDRTSTLTIKCGDIVKTINLVQPVVRLTINPQTLEMDASESSKSFNITTNAEWSINKSELPTWIKDIKPTSGTGDAVINITVNKNTIKKSNSYILPINYASTSASIVVKQAPAANNTPTAPTNLNPAEGATNVSVLPTFKWSNSTDADGDEITYTVMYSTDKVSWTSLSSVNTTSATLNGALGLLKPNSKYYYKVVANDNYENGRAESIIVSFTTGNITAYGDGSYKLYLESKKVNPCILVFTGDGYTKEHFNYGGLFDQNLDRAIEAFFSVEPYKTYKEYFTVYKVAAYSDEAGATITSKHINKKTAFKTVIEGGNSTGISCDYDKAFEYAKKIPNITEEVLYNSGVAVIINEDIYAGTCYTVVSGGKGKCVGMIPVSTGSGNQMTKFENVVIHEFGGHGFGRLADEYVNYNSELPESKKQNLATWQSWGYSLNVSSTANRNEVPWKRFFTASGYGHVSIISGAYYYQSGAYRSESNSCMIDNRKYFNSQSRYMMVERILSIAKEEFSLDKFISKDVQKTDNSGVIGTKVPYDFKPLGKPIMVIK